MTATTIYASVAVLVAAYLINRLILSKKHDLPLPPGPKGLPLLGNFNDLPKPGKMPWIHWYEHKEKYGPISSVTVLGQTIVVLNDTNVTNELLRDRAITHSERPVMTFCCEMVGWENGTGFLPYSDLHKAHRKNFAKVLSAPEAFIAIEKVQLEECAHFLDNLLVSPQDLTDHIRKEAAAVILRAIYGYTPEARGKDPLVDMVTVSMEQLAESSVIGAYTVDVLPFLKYLPDWFPGTGFKQDAKLQKAQLLKTVEQPYAFVEQQMRDQKHKTSYLSKALESEGKDEYSKFVHKWSALAMYIGGADTTVSAIMTFFLLMSVYPEVQTKAQEEIDRVVGNTRLPQEYDKPNLPYIEAVMKEVYRFHPVAPLCVAHASKEEDSIYGYRIPARSILIPNIWGFAHDPETYPSPMSFRPERFLTTPTQSAAHDPRNFIFGFGRRICAGRVMADNAVFMTIAQTLAVLNITKPIGEDGNAIEPRVEFTPGLVSHPEPYQVDIKPRSELHRGLIRKANEMYPWGESDAEALRNVKF